MRARLSLTWEWLTLPAAARRLRRADRRRVLGQDPGIEEAVNAMLGWLGRAQDRSATGEGGFAAHFDMIKGWGPSCPGSTGLAIPTLLRAEQRWGDHSFRQRATWALEWLTALQRPDGGFAATGDSVSAPFITGQAALGLATAARLLGGHADALSRAADYLVAAQTAAGSWPGERVHDTQIAWALLEADALLPGHGFGEAAQANLRWALTQQQRNGWMANCCTDDPARPLTVTIGSAICGFLESYKLGHVLRHLDAGVMTGWALVAVQRRDDGSLPGRLNDRWESASRWSGLSGDAQAAMCWMELHEATKDQAFLSAARAANRFIRRTLSMSGDADQLGGVRGSFPIDGDYGRYRYVTQSAVYAIDSNMMELSLT